MNILFSINHPAHVHFFRNAINIFQGKGNRVVVTTRNKEMTNQLLDEYDIPYISLSKQSNGLLGMAKELIVYEYKLNKILKDNEIDIALSIGGTFTVHICKILSIPSISFSDTENAKLQNNITYPFATRIITPSCYKVELGSKQVRYNGYHELAYLHPKYFKPDLSVLKLLGFKRDEKYVIMRFVSWQAAHDAGHKGLTIKTKTRAVREFSKYAKVFITSEKSLPDELEMHRITISPEKIHDALFYASLLYGESATMASECAIIGTPAIYIDNVGRGYTDEQEKKYGSVFNFKETKEDQEKSIEKGIEILTSGNIKQQWKEKRECLLSDTIDVTEWIVNYIEEWNKTCVA